MIVAGQTVTWQPPCHGSSNLSKFPFSKGFHDLAALNVNRVVDRRGAQDSVREANLGNPLRSTFTFVLVLYSAPDHGQ